nr:FkbM family methyltransferase [uncultured Mucilaginibacter sp.]
MKRTDRIKLNFIRNWNLPGKERLARWFGPSPQLKSALKDGIIWLNNEDIAVYTTADNYIEWTILSTGTYEDEIGKLIKISLKEGDNALDIGGNIGLQSLRMSACIGSEGKIYAFEPLHHIQEKFKKNMALNKASNVTLFEVALSDESGEMSFELDKNTWNQGTFSLKNEVTGTDTQKVIIKIADELPEIQQLEKLALIKIDVEGFEYNVLRGLKATLQKHRPRIIFEYDSNYWQSTGQSIAGCFDYLTGLGYAIYQISDVGAELRNNAAELTGGNLFCLPGLNSN